jgi:tRNA pseudouridine38-40 synthase
MSRKIRMLISYDGSEYFGWQKQPLKKPTVQETLETALSKIFNEPIRVIGSSRTDTGVHAKGQVAHFIAPRDPHQYRLPRSLNSMLPPSLVVREMWEAPDDFHAIASTTTKTYRYFIWNARMRNPFRHRTTTHVDRPLDVSLLNLYSRELLGEHDFRSFQTTGSTPKTSERRIDRAFWRRRTKDLIEFEIRGNGFLKQMVRNIVGTCLDLHFKKQPPDRMIEILQARNRTAAGTTAPAQGLHLWAIEYPAEVRRGFVQLRER